MILVSSFPEDIQENPQLWAKGLQFDIEPIIN